MTGAGLWLAGVGALTAMLLNTGCGVSEPKGDYSQAELNQLVAQFIKIKVTHSAPHP